MSKKNREELKKLQSIQAGIEADIETLEVTVKNIKQELVTKKMNLNQIKQKINNLSKDSEGILISEHAIIRYFERVMGLNLEDITEKILPISDAKLIENLGNGHYPINQGEFKIIVKNGVVVTLYTNEEDKM
ncbi:hypothetical protein [Vaginisenegalia massiliensis]|uniref:hypothetical protein n=1 Tax=Vaginisenegalia massiliensis TaxID=2058294 RepID=UPI000F533F85|nr:hypothetical protein [Vaginisenegalia massiliensis]